jgi:S1-C subfamily serine protease
MTVEDQSVPPPPPPAGAGSSPSGGTAPSGRQRRSEWRRAEKARRYAARNSVRFPIFTRSVLLWMMIFALTGLAFGATGAFWWANFNSQVSQLRSDTQDFESRSASASSNIDAQRKKALAEIAQAVAPLSNLQSANVIPQLAASFSPSVYAVATLDNQGRPSVGTAFAVTTSSSNTLLVTSYTTVQAATVAPGPAIMLTKAGAQIPAHLLSWDAPHDLALLQIDQGGVKVLDWADEKAQSKALGSEIFPISGTGGAGASLTAGQLIDQTSQGFRHTAPIGSDFQGGPIIDVDGKVIGVVSFAYNPLGYDEGGSIHWAVPIADACIRVLVCGGSGARSAGQPGG